MFAAPGFFVLIIMHVILSVHQTYPMQLQVSLYTYMGAI